MKAQKVPIAIALPINVEELIGKQLIECMLGNVIVIIIEIEKKVHFIDLSNIDLNKYNEIDINLDNIKFTIFDAKYLLE